MSIKVDDDGFSWLIKNIIFQELKIRNMSNEFVHSITVPRIYKFTADIVRRVRENGASLKTLIYEKKHPNVAGIYGLAVNTLQALSQLDQLLDKTQILTEQPRLNPWLARVLITELLWRKGCLKSHSKPVLTILTYENKLREESQSLGCIETLVAHRGKVQRPRYVRVNTLLLSVEKAIFFLQKDGWQLLPKSTTYPSYLQSLSQLAKPYFIQDLHVPELLAFPPSTVFHEHSGYQNGELILQDKASSLPVHLLDPINGSVVLDMCAAPGMKTTQVAAKLQNYGKVYAVEVNAKRFEILLNQIKKTRSFCVEPLNQDVLTLDPKLYSHVEYILVDPSCSGSGIVDRPKQNNMDGKPESKRLQNLQAFQVYLLRYALFNFPNVKRIIYSTCSLHPEENEQVVDQVLANIGNAYHLLPVRQLLKNNWTNFSSKKYNCGDRCLYSKPDEDFCNGFFVAIFERNFDVTLPKCKLKGGNEYRNLVEANLDVMAKTTVDKREKDEKEKKKEKRDKKKKDEKEKEEISTSDEQIKTSKIDNKVKTKRSKKEVEKMNIYSNLSNFNNKSAMNKSKDIQKETLENMGLKTSRKKRKSMHENAFQLEIDYDSQEQNKETETKLSKIKKKKKKENKSIIKIDKIYFQKQEPDEESVIGLSKKRKRNK
ncbi:PREDICTED: probable 28S rRNA (cytosine-C(5))-methyltransferase [Wasmannia auropunctata]|uniref:probable 28S rRNA (cytosine-C(5))-methyltransferase n=1 Tax=Wasmannia auropunctata TaxID=64793 RepID=UPI0005F072FE|nr:PREDICTED: probable 28S rRNA (cytosine-C(5))-methyltransferase [Wasmannia auropunctata]